MVNNDDENTFRLQITKRNYYILYKNVNAVTYKGDGTVQMGLWPSLCAEVHLGYFKVT